jgi:hypothetical protein
VKGPQAILSRVPLSPLFVLYSAQAPKEERTLEPRRELSHEILIGVGFFTAPSMVHVSGHDLRRDLAAVSQCHEEPEEGGGIGPTGDAHEKRPFFLERSESFQGLRKTDFDGVSQHGKSEIRD